MSKQDTQEIIAAILVSLLGVLCMFLIAEKSVSLSSELIAILEMSIVVIVIYVVGVLTKRTEK